MGRARGSGRRRPLRRLGPGLRGASQSLLMTEVAISIEWDEPRAVTLGLGDSVLIPKVLGLPGIYRFRLVEAGGRPCVYVGESVNLQRRMAQYAKPGPTQQTNIRLNRRFREVLRNGGAVTFAAASSVVIGVDGQRLDTDLTLASTRRLAENAALVAARADGADQVENIDSAAD